MSKALLTRFITGGLLAPIILYLILHLSFPFYAAISAGLLLLAGYEWTQLMQFKAVVFRFFYFVLLALSLWFSWLLPLPLLFILFGIVWTWGSLAIVYFEKNRLPMGLQIPFWARVYGVLLFMIAYRGLLLIFSLDQGREWLIFFLMIIWMIDIGGYFFGKRFGKHPLVPRVSPNKTWEGVGGGVVFSMCILLNAHLLLKPLPLPFWQLALLVLLGVYFAILGDLVESLFKRLVNVKDSGYLLPGHGGILDRIDSLLAAIPWFALALYFLLLP